MASQGRAAIQALAQAAAADTEHYDAAIAALCEASEVTAALDIVSATGIKLVAQGTRIDSRLRERLGGHGVRGADLEKAAALRAGVRAETLAHDCAALIDHDPWYAQLAARSGDANAMRHGCVRLSLPPAILFRLSVVRAQRPALYQHSLAVTLICHYLALRAQYAEQDTAALLTAALCHDFGELYIDPRWLAPDHRMTAQERRHLYAHPATGWLMLRDLPGLDGAVSRAVAEHHERLDGSGYPKGIAGDEISPLGSALALAEVCASVMARSADQRRLSTVLRLNHQKHDHQLLAWLHEALTPEGAALTPVPYEALAAGLAGFVTLFERWATLREEGEFVSSSAGAFLAQRFANLRTVVLEFGFDPDDLAMPLQLAREDDVIASELATVVEELQYLVADLGREVERHIGEWLHPLSPAAAARLQAWHGQLDQCIARAA